MIKYLITLVLLFSYSARADDISISEFPLTTGTDQLCGWLQADSPNGERCFTIGTGLTLVNGTDIIAQEPEPVDLCSDTELTHADSGNTYTNTCASGLVTVTFNIDVEIDDIFAFENYSDSTGFSIRTLTGANSFIGQTRVGVDGTWNSISTSAYIKFKVDKDKNLVAQGDPTGFWSKN